VITGILLSLTQDIAGEYPGVPAPTSVVTSARERAPEAGRVMIF